MSNPTVEEWRLACIALAVMLRDEYPEDRSLAEIARVWGTDLTEDHVRALEAVEAAIRADRDVVAQDGA